MPRIRCPSFLHDGSGRYTDKLTLPSGVLLARGVPHIAITTMLSTLLFFLNLDCVIRSTGRSSGNMHDTGDVHTKCA